MRLTICARIASNALVREVVAGRPGRYAHSRALPLRALSSVGVLRANYAGRVLSFANANFGPDPGIRVRLMQPAGCAPETLVIRARVDALRGVVESMSGRYARIKINNKGLSTRQYACTRGRA